jgi:hypothetical protein
MDSTFNSDILGDLVTLHEGQFSTPKYVSTKRQRDDKPQEPRQRQHTDPISTSLPNQLRPQKPRPNRQPKGWSPTTPPSSGVLPPASLKGESEIRQRSSTSPAADQTPATPLASTSQPPFIFNSNNTQSQFSASTLSPIESTSSTDSSNSWDLNHLMLAQMNFDAMPQSLGSSMSQALSFSSGFGGPGGLTLGDQASVPPPLANREHSLSSMSPFIGQNQLVSQDMTALWSDAPSDFK